MDVVLFSTAPDMNQWQLTLSCWFQCTNLTVEVSNGRWGAGGTFTIDWCFKIALPEFSQAVGTSGKNLESSAVFTGEILHSAFPSELH